MKIRTALAYPPNNWTAVDDDTYDGPGSPIGTGQTEQEAIDDLLVNSQSNLEDAMRYVIFIAAGVMIGMPLGTLATPHIVIDFPQWCAAHGGGR